MEEEDDEEAIEENNPDCKKFAELCAEEARKKREGKREGLSQGVAAERLRMKKAKGKKESKKEGKHRDCLDLSQYPTRKGSNAIEHIALSDHGANTVSAVVARRWRTTAERMKKRRKKQRMQCQR